MSFERALPVILRSEGGYVDDPQDLGGATNQGITQKTYNAWRKPERPVREITSDEVSAIYKQRYWKAGRSDGLAWPVSLVHFDSMVQHRPKDAIRMLQSAVNLSGHDLAVDGSVGPKTLAAANLSDSKALVEELLWQRLAYYRGLANHTNTLRRKANRKFLPIWIRRLEHLRIAAV